MAVTYDDPGMELQLVARAIARRAAAFPPERRRYILGPAITEAAARHFQAAAMPTAADMVDFIDALTMAVFDEIEELDASKPP